MNIYLAIAIVEGRVPADIDVIAAAWKYLNDVRYTWLISECYESNTVKSANSSQKD